MTTRNDEVLTITNAIREALDKAGQLLSQVRDNRLYEKIGYGSFSGYIAGEFSEQFSRSTAYRMMKQAEMNSKLSRVRDNLSQNAAAELNKCSEDYQVIIAQTAHSRANGNQITAGDIGIARDVITEIARTAHVSIDDEVTPIDGALTNATYEKVMRRKQHIADRSEWKTCVTFEGTGERMKSIIPEIPLESWDGLKVNFSGDWPEDILSKQLRVIVQELVHD